MKSPMLSLVAGVLPLILMAFIEPLAAAQSEVVFDNTSNLINQRPEFSFGREYGDELALAGTGRWVTAFRFAYYGNFSNTAATFSVRFYANDGTDAFPGAPVAFRPHSLLWESGNQPMSNGANAVNLAVPEILVPDKFTWTITFNGLDGTIGKQAALMLANPATIGALLPGTSKLPPVVGSYDDFWKKDDPSNAESWTLYSFGYGPDDPKGTFYAKVTAIPEPRPNLKIARVGQKVILSWPAASGSYILENYDLASSGQWSETLPPPANLSGVNYVTNSLISGKMFYRLRSP